jgi:uncharacterized paraquat-inducible protein A
MSMSNEKMLRKLIKQHKMFGFGNLLASEILTLCSNCHCMVNAYCLEESEQLSAMHCPKCKMWIAKPECSPALEKLLMKMIG